MTPLEALKRSITRWEGGWQAQPQDQGNYVMMPDGSRRLIGTMRGVTPATWAAYKGKPAASITVEEMQAITLDDAAAVGLARFYQGTGLDMLPWGPATEVLVDVGWGSGPRQAILFAQRLSGASDDGIVGPKTVEAYSRWIASVGWEKAVRAIRDMRMAFYDLIIKRNPAWEIYRQGWYNRANWMLPESAEWWGPWAADPAPLPMVGGIAQPLPKAPDPVLMPAPQKPIAKSRTFWTQVGQWLSGLTTAGAGLSVSGIADNLPAAQAIITFWKTNQDILIIVGLAVMVLSAVQFAVKISERKAEREGP